MSNGILTEADAFNELSTLFDKCKADGFLEAYSLNIAETKPDESSKDSYIAIFTMVVKKQDISAEVRKRTIRIIQESECEYEFLGTHHEYRSTVVDVLVLSARITP